MKKLLTVLLCLLMCLGLTACSTKKTIDTEKVYEGSIPLGGNLEDVILEGPSFGSYKEIEPSEEFVYDGIETHIYYDENSVNPYIMTYRWNKNGQTLEDVTKEQSELYSDGYYQMEEDSGWSSLAGKPCGYICTNFTYKDNFYYTDIVIVEDGNDFLELVIWSATEEVVLGDSGKAIWVPKGYTDILNANERAHGSLFWAYYDEANYIPSIWVGQPNYSYDYFKWFWSDDEGFVLPYTQEEYENKIVKLEWTEENATKYYKDLGTDLVYSYYEEKDGVKAYLYSLVSDEWGTKDTDIWLEIGDKNYQIWTEKVIMDATPYIGGTLIDSIHDTDRKVYADAIPLGGTPATLPVVGDTYGVYEEVDYATVAEEEVTEGVEAHAYVSKGSDVPCICTYRFPANGYKLKDVAQSIADEYSDGEYMYFDDLRSVYDIDVDAGMYFCTGYNSETGYYYVDSLIFEDGDEFVEIDWYAKTEEVEVGDSGVYMWVPTGYTDNITDEFKQHGIFFSVQYEESYDLPLIGGVKLDKTYEQMCFIWDGDDSFEMSEEEFYKFMEITDWTEDVDKQYYDSLNMKKFLSKTDEANGYKYEVVVCMLKDGTTRVDDAYLYIGDDIYEFWLEYPEGHIEFVTDALMNSLHTK